MNVFHEDSLVLENITLALHVQIVVEMTIDFLGFAVFLQETTEDTHSCHPKVLLWHTSVGCTLTLTIATVTPLTTSDGVLTHTEARVHNDGLLDDQTILDELANVLTWRKM
jgi:hypothetical protein